MKALRVLSPVGAALLILSVPAAAEAAGGYPVVTRVSSLPGGAGATHAYVLRTVVVNGSTGAVRSVVTAHLLRVGSRPLALGSVPVRLAPGASAHVRLPVRLPRL